MESKRFYETVVDGRKAVADTATGVIHFDAVMRNDSLGHTDVIVMKGEKLPGPGERKCWNCGLRWILEAGGEDVCPSCRRPNVIPGTPPPKVEIVLPRRNYEDESPGETLKRSQKIIRQIKTPAAPELTVGDLSYATKVKNKGYRQRLDSMNRGLTVGDLSFASEQRSKGEKQHLDSVRRGLTVGDLSFTTSRKDVCTLPPSPSEEIHAQIIAKHNEKQEEVFKIKQMVFDIQQAKEAREQRVKDERRRLFGF
jgi:hypothetical protein